MAKQLTGSSGRRVRHSLAHGVALEVFKPRALLSSLAAVIVLGLLPALAAFGGRSGSLLAFPSALYALIVSKNPIVLLFALAATVPYVMNFGGQVSHRFLTYARIRDSIRRLLTVRLISNAVLVFPTFFLIGIIPQFLVEWGGITAYKPEGYGLTTGRAVWEAELGYVTFSQLRVYGTWAFPVAYSVWLALEAVLFATFALCLTTFLKSRLLGLSLAWIVDLVAMFIFAVLGWEAYSPGLICPFNLTQLPLRNLLVPFGLEACIAAVLVGYLLIRAPSLDQLQ